MRRRDGRLCCPLVDESRSCFRFARRHDGAMTIRPPMPPASDGQQNNACGEMLQDAFLALAARASDAGWPRDEVARALLRLAGAYVLHIDSEHDRGEAIAVIRKTMQ